jgi:hypothetical protein
MNNTNTGGPAFPSHGSMGEVAQEGMTLRDYFAAKAMQGICAGVFPIVKEEDPLPTVARAAYAQADAMLKAREA